MIRFGKWVVKHKTVIFIVSLLLLIPSIWGYQKTKINYDILSYLPDDIETMKGQDILVKEFGTGGFSFVIVDNMEDKDVVALKNQIKKVDHVAKVVWYDSFADLSIPKEMLPKEAYDLFNKDDSTMMAVLFENATSSDETMDAISDIRSICNKQCYISGMSAVVTDIKDISVKETAMYVLIAAGLSLLVLGLTIDSFLVPVLFLLSIGMAVLYNLGSNVAMGSICFITKALAAVLQLGVTMDYSIFLWHSYCEQKKRFDNDKERAMAHAISSTVTSVVSSSVTTVAGFLALCFMTYRLGMDLGLVMAKGVVIGVICCVTVLPSMILIFDKAIEKTRHKDLLPNFSFASKLVTKHYIIFAVLLVVLMVPSLYGYSRTKVYYNLDETLPKDLDSIIANEKLSDTFQMDSTHMILVDKNLGSKDVLKMSNEMEAVDGVKAVMGLDSIIGSDIPGAMIPDSVKEVLESDEYKLMLVSSEYKVASDEVNAQVDNLNTILKKYDEDAMLIGEAPCTKDLIDITDRDFKVVTFLSTLAIFLIIFIVFRSISIPVILVTVIELAIFINMGIPYYTNTTLPFVASVVIGTIQLGATVDYAILMTTRYKKERCRGAEKKEAVQIASMASNKSIVVSALSFFAATFGVGVYSEIGMISALCSLMSRGAFVSMFVVIFILPAMFMVCDKLICHTSIGFGPGKAKQN